MMENSKILLYDGSFNGFLSCVYHSFDQAYFVSDIRDSSDTQKALFADMVTVETNIDNAKRVWDTIEKRHYQAVKKIYFAFLSEQKGIELLLYRFIRSLFGHKAGTAGDSSPSLIPRIESLALQVASEKKLLEKQLNFFQKQGFPDQATLSPVYNILPLLTRHLRAHFSDRDWLLYDCKRHYGFYYDRLVKSCIRLDEDELQQMLRHTEWKTATVNPSVPDSGYLHLGRNLTRDKNSKVRRPQVLSHIQGSTAA